MPNVADILQYRHFRKTNLPFITATAPTSTDPNFVAGLNIMTSYKGYLERRPGFDVGSGLETSPSAFSGTIKRVFAWRRWNGTFYIMLNAVTMSQSIVYKLAVGTDASFVSLFTSASTETFDFVTSNNFCFFGNGTDMKKYDGTSVTNWGISISLPSPVGPNGCGTGANVAVGGAANWVNPGNITAQDGNFATVTLTGSGVNTSNFLYGSNFGFAIPAASTIVGIVVEVKGLQTVPGAGAGTPQFGVNLTLDGTSYVGPGKLSQLPASNAFISVGSSTDLWGSTLLTPTSVNASSFGVFINTGITGANSCSWSVDFVRVTIYALAAPSATVSGSAGTFSAANGGYQYVYCYYNAITGHVSSPTPASTATGNFTNKLNVGVAVLASPDPQVTNIRLFRTTDGGGGVYFEVQSSPYPNSTGTITDNTTDANLSLITAPTFGFNDPPPPQKGFVWFANRIWGFNNASVFFTDWEEMNIGTPEEGSVSGSAGNFWNFDSEVTGLSLAQDGVIIFTAGSIYKIDGDSLDTFRRTVIAKGIGCRNRATIARLGGLTAFLANTNSIWTTDSTSLTEISQWQQPTIDNIDHSQASMTFHIQGQYRWLLLADPSHSQTLVFDVNENQWMPPWSIVPTAMHSGETSPGNWTLLVGQSSSNKMLQMTPGVYFDNGAAYAASFTTNLIPVINEHMSSANPVIDLYYPQAPGHVAYAEYVGFDFNNITPNQVLFEFDDDPQTSSYTDVTGNIKDPALYTQGVNVLSKWYYIRKPVGKRISIKMNWNDNALPLATDAFNRGDSNPIGAPWTVVTGQQAAQLKSGVFAPASVGVGTVYAMTYTGPSWPNDQYTQAALMSLFANEGYAALILRATPGGDFYYCGFDASPGFGGMGATTTVHIWKHVSGITSIVASTFTVPNVGDTFRATAIGNQIQLLQNGTVILTGTDSAISAGAPGLFIQTVAGTASVSDITWDNWQGGSLTLESNNFKVYNMTIAYKQER